MKALAFAGTAKEAESALDSSNPGRGKKETAEADSGAAARNPKELTRELAELQIKVSYLRFTISSILSAARLKP